MKVRLGVVRSLAATAFREYWRTPEALFWSYGFPLMMALVLGLAFARGSPQPVSVAVLADAPAAARIVAALERHARDDVRATLVEPAHADRELALGRVDVVIGGAAEEPELRLDPSRAEARLARLLVTDALRRASGVADTVRAEIRPVEAPGDRYIDFLIPGLIGLNLMGAGLFGVGHNLVLLRSRHLLRRFAVTPLGRAEFLLGFVWSRFVLSLPAPVVLVLFGWLAFDVPMLGSWPLLAVIVVVGALVFAGLGVLVASRARTLEAVSGLMNLVMMPMWLLCGAFFSSERFPAIVQPIVHALPLTHLNDALRAVMRGDGLAASATPLLWLSVSGIAFFVAALRLFRWS